MEKTKTLENKTFLAVWAVLLAFTGMTIFIAGLDLGFLNVVAALTIATGKAILVILFFMDLRHEIRLFRNMLLIAMLVLALFVGLTFLDIAYRY